ncbi:hypothetical protein N7493_004548 [Penicillium malachiteum]|uniref:Uncharacterized protein n=1 Tax=Penicillium malachiteum TaxID=1324776 RepID=A0AAD6MX53_9EURO|nr:hypothetical protein N7493_004548 [Penicillium malachiteum]
MTDLVTEPKPESEVDLGPRCNLVLTAARLSLDIMSFEILMLNGEYFIYTSDVRNFTLTCYLPSTILYPLAPGTFPRSSLHIVS